MQLRIIQQPSSEFQCFQEKIFKSIDELSADDLQPSNVESRGIDGVNYAVVEILEKFLLIQLCDIFFIAIIRFAVLASTLS